METDSPEILITGGAGYLGSMLTNQLLFSGFRVKVLDSMLFGSNSLLHVFGHSKFQLIHEDIRNLNKKDSILDNVHAVIHLAAIVGEHLCKKIPEEAYQINQESTIKLIDACRKKNIERFVFASTCSNYGDIGEKEFADEKSQVQPISIYSRTKVESENYILNDRSEICSTVLRFATLYGVSQRMRLDLLLHELLTDAIIHNKITLYGANFWRPLIHIRDAVKAIIATLSSPKNKVNNQVFNVGNTDENYSKIKLAEMIKQKIPDTEIVIEDKKQDLRNYKVSFNKIKKELGFKTEKTVENGIDEIINAFKYNLINTKDESYNNVTLKNNINMLIENHEKN